MDEDQTKEELPLRARQLFDMTGMTAVVVGAGSGLGQSSALGLADFGARVECCDARLDAAKATAELIRGQGGSAKASFMDVTNLDSIRAVVAEVGAPDALVVTPAVNVRKRLLEISDSEFDAVTNVNLKGTFMVLREFAATMAARGSGSIIAFSSIRAQVVEPGQGVYAATKAGVLQLVKTFAAELGPLGVRANVIAPGVVETPLTAPIQASSDWYKAYADKSVFGRWAQPSEYVGAVVFLASKASSYVTGSYLVVDGGWLAADGRFTPPL